LYENGEPNKFAGHAPGFHIALHVARINDLQTAEQNEFGRHQQARR
jgi:hypothetical protein